MERNELRVLIVDDNREAAAMLGRVLDLAGFTVVAQIYDAAQALDCIQQEKPHVAILDIAMPFLDGGTLATRVRQLIVPAPLLIAVSGFGTASDKEQAIDAGFNYHLTKPADWRELEGILLQHMRRLETAG